MSAVKTNRKKAPQSDLRMFKSGGKTVMVSRKGNLFKLKWLP